ncbi:MAG: phosphate starvation-inducible protein PhoH, partial [Pseudomonadota bacterium]
MTFSALNPPDADAPDHELLLEYPDNRLLIDLCGEFDSHLTQIESTLGVQIVRRGNQLAVMGDAREEGARVLNALYVR